MSLEEKLEEINELLNYLENGSFQRIGSEKLFFDKIIENLVILKDCLQDKKKYEDELILYTNDKMLDSECCGQGGYPWK